MSIFKNDCLQDFQDGGLDIETLYSKQILSRQMAQFAKLTS